jgi:glycosyltransferase involved in cell wall biosynthesis
MVDHKTAHLQSEINRIAEKLNATSRAIQVGVMLKDDDYNILLDDDGMYHYSYWERGKQRFDRVGDIDDVLYWFAADITFDIGGSYSAQHSPENQDFRILMWAKQYELLNEINPRWAQRCVRETAGRLRSRGKDQGIELLPSIPELDSPRPTGPW